MSEAAEFGQLQCLIFLRSQGVNWDYRTCKMARENGHRDVYEYAVENGCPTQAPEPAVTQHHHPHHHHLLHTHILGGGPGGGGPGGGAPGGGGHTAAPVGHMQMLQQTQAAAAAAAAAAQQQQQMEMELEGWEDEIQMQL